MKKKDLERFMEYLKEQFPGCIEDDWTGKLIENIIDYAYRNHGHSKGVARNIVYSLLPDVSVEDAEKYLPDFDEWEADHNNEAAELEKITREKLKSEKFEKLMDIQRTKISESMQDGKKSVIWVFSDKGYYHNDLERAWFDEFDGNARKQFIKAGYKIKGASITW